MAERASREVRHLRSCRYRRPVPGAWLLRMAVRRPSQLPHQVRGLPRVTRLIVEQKAVAAMRRLFRSHGTIPKDGSFLAAAATVHHNGSTAPAAYNEQTICRAYQ